MMAGMAVAAELLGVLELPYSDLLLLAGAGNGDLTKVAPAERCRLQAVAAAVAGALGPGGAGLVAVSGDLRAATLRRHLLPLASRLALLPDHERRARLLKKHGLGSDVPLKKLDRSVSSFAMLLKYSGESQLPRLLNKLESSNDGLDDVEENSDVHRFQESHDGDFEKLGELFKELGLCMMEIGVLVARVCDIAIGGKELEQGIMDFGTAKARLIHYHSELDNFILKETSGKRKGSKKKQPNRPHPAVLQESGDETMVDGTSLKQPDTKNSLVSLSNLWQQWHYDYGIFTVLTAPMFLSSDLGEECSIIQEECPSPDGHTYLQLFDRRKNMIFSVKCPPESLLVQVGEAADMLSRGKLRSTLHSVSRPLSLPNISRETFVVFLQPAWDKTLSYSGRSFLDEDETSSHDGLAYESETDILMREILGKIPPLSSRRKDGMTFAEFSRQTTKQYYGGGGTQQNN